MLINLLEIPIEGKSFIINETTGDLNEALHDLIGKSSFKTEFSIFPMQSGTYELKGHIKTNSVEDCSRCGDDFQLKIEEKFHEILMPELETPRNGHYAKPNHVSDLKQTDLGVYEFSGHLFNMGNYMHEIIGLAKPMSPAPACDKSGKCQLCHKDVSQEFKYEDPGFENPDKPEKNPFAALKNIKLN